MEAQVEKQFNDAVRSTLADMKTLAESQVSFFLFSLKHYCVMMALSILLTTGSFFVLGYCVMMALSILLILCC